MKLNVGLSMFKLFKYMVKWKPIKPSNYMWGDASQDVEVPPKK